MSKVEFKAWDKIPRENPFKTTITEKMNGTNACIIIMNDEIVGIQSRKRLITVDDDNYGFSRWVEDNKEDIMNLGEGYHYGEWAGLGIQKNPHNLNSKKFFLFNTFRWNPDNPNRPECCDVVPVLFQGLIDNNTIEECLNELKFSAKEGETPEGVVVYYHAFRKYTKHTIKSPNGKWCKD